MKSEFANNVYEMTTKIPLGNVMTYGQIAKLLGNPRASQAVGKVLAANTNLKIPCHRVVCGDGKISGYFGSSSCIAIKNRIKIMEHEGIEIKNGKIIGLNNILFDPNDQDQDQNQDQNQDQYQDE